MVKDEMDGTCGTNREREIYIYIYIYMYIYRVFVQKPLGRTSQRWEDNIKIDFNEIGWEGADWIYKGNESSGSINCLTG
jgi:hypothetical protein